MKHITLAFLLSAVGLLSVQNMSQASSKQQAVAVSAPSMTVMLEPYSPDGQLRQYAIPGGASYWTTDLPIYTSDKVKIDVFVATGANDLQRMKVRLDNQQLTDIAQAPWATSFDASKLGPGYHFVEAWAQVSGVKASTPQFVTHTLTFFISTADASLPAPAKQPVVEVKGQQEILTGNKIVNVPLGQPDPAPLAPSLPDVLRTSTVDPNASITLRLQDMATGIDLTGSDGYQVKNPAVVVVNATPGSGVHKFVYEIVSADSPVVTDNTPYSTSYTRIRLQPTTASSPGLLPGTAYVWVWGIADSGRYSQPVYAKVDVQSSQ